MSFCATDFSLSLSDFSFIIITIILVALHLIDRFTSGEWPEVKRIISIKYGVWFSLAM